MFDTKIAIVVRDDLPVWQKLNVTAFLMSGIVGAAPGIIGERYKDAAGNLYSSLCIQPVIVLAADQQTLSIIHRPSLGSTGAPWFLHRGDVLDGARCSQSCRFRPAKPRDSESRRDCAA